jgi:hypothetical protein
VTKPVRAKAPKTRIKARVEGRDERLMVQFAFLLVAIVAAVAIYQTMAWVQVWAHVWAHG